MGAGRPTQQMIDQIFALPLPPDDSPGRDDLLTVRAAKIGWARPTVLTPEEVRSICRTLVIYAAQMGIH